MANADEFYVSNAAVVSNEYDSVCEALENRINKYPDEKNIGVIGPLGSGKSSFIKSFVARNNAAKKKAKKNIKVVSLCDFSTNSSAARGPIEREIVKQLIGSVPWWKIPNSNLLTLSPKGKTKIFCFVFAILSVLSGVLIAPLSGIAIKGKGWASLSNLFIILCVLFGFASLILLYLWKPFSSISFKVKDVEANANLEKQNDRNEFQVLFDELAYFFGRTETNVVVFEDLDRFGNIEIITELRNLNFSLNASAYVKRRCHNVVFVYVVSDEKIMSTTKEGRKTEILTGGGRAKLFDFVIPIEPIVSPYNSAEDLMNGIRKYHKNEEDIRESTFFALAPFINEKRICTNVINDFIFFSEHQNKKDWNRDDYESLLSLCVYKNLYPEHFADFQIGGNGSALSRIYKGNSGNLGTSDSEKNEFALVSVIKDNGLLKTPSLHYVSTFNDALFPNECDKILFDNIKLKRGLPTKVFQCKDPGVIIRRLTPKDMTEESAIHPSLFQFIMNYDKDGGGDCSEQCKSFIESFSTKAWKNNAWAAFYSLISLFWKRSSTDRGSFEKSCVDLLNQPAILATGSSYYSFILFSENRAPFKKYLGLYSALFCSLVSYAAKNGGINGNDSLRVFLNTFERPQELLRGLNSEEIAYLFSKANTQVANIDHMDDSEATKALIDKGLIGINEHNLRKLFEYCQLDFDLERMFTMVSGSSNDYAKHFFGLYKIQLLEFIRAKSISLNESSNGYSYLFALIEKPNGYQYLEDVLSKAHKFDFAGSFPNTFYQVLISSKCLKPSLQGYGMICGSKKVDETSALNTFIESIDSETKLVYSKVPDEDLLIKALLTNSQYQIGKQFENLTSALKQIDDYDASNIATLSVNGLKIAVECHWIKTLSQSVIDRIAAVDGLFAKACRDDAVFEQIRKDFLSKLTKANGEIFFARAKEKALSKKELSEIFAAISKTIVTDDAEAKNHQSDIETLENVPEETIGYYLSSSSILIDDKLTFAEKHKPPLLFPELCRLIPLVSDQIYDMVLGSLATTKIINPDVKIKKLVSLLEKNGEAISKFDFFVEADDGSITISHKK